MRLLLFHLHPLWIQPPHRVLIFFFEAAHRSGCSDRQSTEAESVFVLGGSQIWGEHDRFTSVRLVGSGSACRHFVCAECVCVSQLCVWESVMGVGGLKGVSCAQLRPPPPPPLFSQRWSCSVKACRYWRSKPVLHYTFWSIAFLCVTIVKIVGVKKGKYMDLSLILQVVGHKKIILVCNVHYRARLY